MYSGISETVPVRFTDKAYSDFASMANESHNIVEKRIEEHIAGFRLHAEPELPQGLSNNSVHYSHA
jgi:hypothetical protein